jgi:hypothetical protein
MEVLSVTRLKLSFDTLKLLLAFSAAFVGCNGFSGDESSRVVEESSGRRVPAVALGGAEERALEHEGIITLPSSCQTDKFEKAFLHGAQKGRNRVAVTWKKYDSCERLEEFVDEFMLQLEGLLPEADSNKTRKNCRYSGQVEGTFLELEVIQQRCESRCFMNGDFVGQVEAKAYCDLAIDATGELDPVQWLRKPVGICGFAFELGCDVSFVANTLAYTNDVGACEPYTRSPFFGIWDGFRAESCDYHQNPM